MLLLQSRVVVEAMYLIVLVDALHAGHPRILMWLKAAPFLGLVPVLQRPVNGDGLSSCPMTTTPRTRDLFITSSS